VSQILGALAASLLLLALFPSHLSLGATLPAGSDAQSFILELVLTAILMFVILKVSSGAKERGITAGIVVGSVIALEALFAGADMWCLNEFSMLISPRFGVRATFQSMAISCRTNFRGFDRCRFVSRNAGRGLLQYGKRGCCLASEFCGVVISSDQ